MELKDIHLVWKEMAIRHFLDTFEDEEGNELEPGALFDLIWVNGEKGQAKSVFRQLNLTVRDRYIDAGVNGVADYIVNMATLCQGNARHELVLRGLVAVPAPKPVGPQGQARVLEEGNGSAAYNFAKDVPGADIAALQARVLEVGNSADAYVFARDVPGADIAALQARVLMVGNGSAAYVFAKHIPGADMATLQARVLEVGNSVTAYLFAKDVPGADIAALQARVLEVGNSADAYVFARDVPGADIAALQARVLMVGNGSAAYVFAKHIPGADIAALYERVESLGFAGLNQAQQELFKGLRDAQQPDSIQCIGDSP